VAALHDLQYLPLEIWALSEGTRVPLRVPSLVVFNTHPDFAWVTNYIETDLSANLWGPCTAATIADQYRQTFEYWMKETGGDPSMVDFMGHDFSYRGMYGTEAAAMSGAAHLLSFKGTDTIPAIDFLEKYYHADSAEIGGSVPATEHSVMCAGTKENELETYRRLITEVYPSGIVSIVSDTWDYWKVLTEILPALKDEIMARDGTVVVRPDSGNPVDILVGTCNEGFTPEEKGTFELLWETFGGTVNSKGFKQLDPHIGAIYGDSITLERQRAICSGLAYKGFVPTAVLGIGSFTYQHITRDTFGHALKSTACIVNGEVREIFKDPVTDDGTKKSARGFTAVYRDETGKLYLKDQVSLNDVRSCEFQRVFKDGEMGAQSSLEAIRHRLRK
jgi:nicotinamide phosphoribosyltransferase